MWLDYIADNFGGSWAGTRAAYDRPPVFEITAAPQSVSCGATCADTRTEIERISGYWINAWGEDDTVDFDEAHERSLFYLGQKFISNTRVVNHSSPDNFNPYNSRFITETKYFQWGRIFEERFGRNFGRSTAYAASVTADGALDSALWLLDVHASLHPKSLGALLRNSDIFPYANLPNNFFTDSNMFQAPINPRTLEDENGNTFTALGGPAKVQVCWEGLSRVPYNPLSPENIPGTAEQIIGILLEDASPRAHSYIPALRGIQRFAKKVDIALKVIKAASAFLTEMSGYEARRRQDEYAHEICRHHDIPTPLEGPNLVLLLSCYVDLKLFSYMFFPYFNNPRISFFIYRKHPIAGNYFDIRGRYFNNMTPYQADRLIYNAAEAAGSEEAAKAAAAEAAIERLISQAKNSVAHNQTAWNHFSPGGITIVDPQPVYDQYLESVMDEFRRYLGFYGARLDSVEASVEEIFKPHKEAISRGGSAARVENPENYNELYDEAKKFHNDGRWE